MRKNKNLNWKEFFSVNGLKRRELAAYIGVSQPFMTNIVQGTSAISDERLDMVVNNDKGWDVDVLFKEPEPAPTDPSLFPEGATNEPKASDALRTVLNPSANRLLIELAEQRKLTAKAQEQLSKAQEQIDKLLNIIAQALPKA